MKTNIFSFLAILAVIICGTLIINGCCDYDNIDYDHNKAFTIINMNSEEGMTGGKFKRPTVYKLLLLRSVDDTTKYVEYNVGRLVNGTALFYTKKIGDTIVIPEVYKQAYFTLKK